MNMIESRASGGRTRTLLSAFVAVGMAILFSATALAQAPAATGSAAAPQASGDLTQLVGRIALYPDDLVAIILPASTSPLQIVQAERLVQRVNLNLALGGSFDPRPTSPAAASGGNPQASASSQ